MSRNVLTPHVRFIPPLNSTVEIERFPDSIPYTDEDGIGRFKEGRDDKDKVSHNHMVCHFRRLVKQPKMCQKM